MSNCNAILVIFLCSIRFKYLCKIFFYLFVFDYFSANHLQSPRSLFLDSTSRETLSSRQPSFNPLIATQNSSFEKSSSLLSPFYPGNTMFGGANAANMFRKSKSLLANTSQVVVFFTFSFNFHLTFILNLTILRVCGLLFINIVNC